MITPIRANYDAKGIEKDIQEYWKSEHAYEKTREARKDGKKFYFVDGPPYTTGAIHLGTAMNKTVKDIMIRYWSMNGYNIRDQPGFDMHGLPIEVKVEKNIGVHSKKDIEELGIDKFVETCKSFAQGLREDMTEQFKQLGVWMDWDNPYQTIKLDYIESAWWTLQRAYEKGLLKDSSRVVTWCPRCETALAEAEIEYWDETDPSIMVRFPIKGDNASLLIWTTTPWTLAANMAVAVHP
ncbi:MAG: class I tRNA ligase family protein, partial [Candidatus Methanomethylophilaceae archaeon]|nr:class I tRNA ligase family protein [Candidatus Methanomethylophilaceae archaeon]